MSRIDLAALNTSLLFAASIVIAGKAPRVSCKLKVWAGLVALLLPLLFLRSEPQTAVWANGQPLVATVWLFPTAAQACHVRACWQVLGAVLWATLIALQLGHAFVPVPVGAFHLACALLSRLPNSNVQAGWVVLALLLWVIEYRANAPLLQSAFAALVAVANFRMGRGRAVIPEVQQLLDNRYHGIDLSDPPMLDERSDLSDSDIEDGETRDEEASRLELKVGEQDAAAAERAARLEAERPASCSAGTAECALSARARVAGNWRVVSSLDLPGNVCRMKLRRRGDHFLHVALTAQNSELKLSASDREALLFCANSCHKLTEVVQTKRRSLLGSIAAGTLLREPPRPNFPIRPCKIHSFLPKFLALVSVVVQRFGIENVNRARVPVNELNPSPCCPGCDKPDPTRSNNVCWITLREWIVLRTAISIRSPAKRERHNWRAWTRRGAGGYLDLLEWTNLWVVNECKSHAEMTRALSACAQAPDRAENSLFCPDFMCPSCHPEARQPRESVASLRVAALEKLEMLRCQRLITEGARYDHRVLEGLQLELCNIEVDPALVDRCLVWLALICRFMRGTGRCFEDALQFHPPTEQVAAHLDQVADRMHSLAAPDLGGRIQTEWRTSKFDTLRGDWKTAPCEVGALGDVDAGLLSAHGSTVWRAERKHRGAPLQYELCVQGFDHKQRAAKIASIRHAFAAHQAATKGEVSPSSLWPKLIDSPSTQRHPSWDCISSKGIYSLAVGTFVPVLDLRHPLK